MASQYTPKQIRNGAVGSDYAPGAQEASVSDDNQASVAQTQRLQREAQDQINAARHPGIGSAP